MTLYASYGESTRAPTPVELACASEDAPCNLPNAFLADPPLEQVVAKSVEAGLRSDSDSGLRWHVGGFHTVNHDDILFQTTGGPQANVGFFDNVGDTRRAGIELSLSQRLARLHWFVEYSYIDATFEDGFIVNSPNHPVFEDDPDAPADRRRGQTAGDLRRAAFRAFRSTRPISVSTSRSNDRFSFGADVDLRSGVYLRGDEANLLDKTDGYAILNLRGEYRFGDK